MYILLGKPRSLSDLKELALNPIGMLRARAKIVLIDDQPFVYKDLLQNHGFHIDELRDITSIQAVEAYDIVLCDIKGVGISLNKRLQGAHVISEIRKRYPFKYVIAYSGSSFNATFNESFKMSDDFIRKDEEEEKWVAALDNAVEESLDPRRRWKKLRQTLIERDVPLADLLKLENDFVRSIQEKNPNRFTQGKSSISASPETKELLSKFAIQIVAKLITESLGS